MKKPQVILTRHYKNGIISARPSYDPWYYAASADALIPRGEGRYVRADLGLKLGDYLEGYEDGWKDGQAQECRAWDAAVKLSFGTVPQGLTNALAEVRKDMEEGYE